MSDVDITITRTASPSEVVEELVESMGNLGRAMGRRAQRVVPKLSYALHDTIRSEVEASGSKVSAIVTAGGGDVGYALYVERGTSRMAAQPYLRPALMQTRSGDLAYTGAGPTPRGVVKPTTARSRRRARGRSR